MLVVGVYERWTHVQLVFNFLQRKRATCQKKTCDKRKRNQMWKGVGLQVQKVCVGGGGGHGAQVAT